MSDFVRRFLQLRYVLTAGAVWTYCLIFPEDLKSLLSPLTSVLQLSNAASPGLYGLVAVIVVMWFIERTWGRTTGK